MHHVGERHDHGLLGEGSTCRVAPFFCTAKTFEENIRELLARYRWKEEIERIRHSEAAVGGERDERHAAGIEGRVGE